MSHSTPTLFDLAYYTLSKPPKAAHKRRWYLVRTIDGVDYAFITGHDNGSDEWERCSPHMRTPRKYKTQRGAAQARIAHGTSCRVEEWLGKEHFA